MGFATTRQTLDEFIGRSCDRGQLNQMIVIPAQTHELELGLFILAVTAHQRQCPSRSNQVNVGDFLTFFAVPETNRVL
jgi:hypothetical protein